CSRSCKRASTGRDNAKFQLKPRVFDRQGHAGGVSQRARRSTEGNGRDILRISSLNRAALRRRLVRLSKFILAELEHILGEWEHFARTLMPPAASVDRLRDHAREILVNIAQDMEAPQSASA